MVPDPLVDDPPVVALPPAPELSELPPVPLLPELPVLPVASLPVEGVVEGVDEVSVWLLVPDEVPVVPCEVLDVSCANADPMMAARHSVIVLRRK